MRVQSFASVLVVGAVLAVPIMSVLACGPGWVEPSFEGNTEGGAGAQNGDGGPAGGDACKTLELLTDLSGLTACCQDEGGQAHCLDESKATDGLKAKMAKCSGGGLCVPDHILKNGNKVKKCTTQFTGPNAPGACRSLCIPEVKERKSLLKQLDCDPGEVCAPCINPLTGQPSGACPDEAEEKKREEDCKKGNGGGAPAGDAGPATPAPEAKKCCEDKGTCVSKDLLKPEQQEKTNSKGCEAETQKCVPTEIVDAVRAGKEFKGTKCTPNFLLGGGAGVCLSKCLEFGLQGIILTQEQCTPDQVCAPCVFGGKPTGAPGCE